MENNNIRTMELIGVDDWSRPVYKCIENNILWKDVDLGNGHIELCSCGNEFDGEPDSPIKKSLQIIFLESEEKQPTEQEKFNYMMLSRLKSDCDYYLNYGNRNNKNLWAVDEQKQINEMKRLYNNFSDDKKPEWLTMENILQYEKLMVK